jgi:UDP:flavonoid glycosyltransferase YjiC (YdhE family)
MRRIGILSFSSPGHFYPLTALGRRLQSRGHEVVYFQVADLERPIRAAGLEFRQIGQEDFPLGTIRARDEELCQLKGLAALRCGLRGIRRKAMMLFRDAPAAIRDASIPSSSTRSRWRVEPSPNTWACRSPARRPPCQSTSTSASHPLSFRGPSASALGPGFGTA